MRPLIGITCCTKAFGVFATPNHAASDTYVRAVDRVIGGVPVLLPANGEDADIQTLLARLDGIILTGSRSNVHPTLYGGLPHATGTPEDRMRDGVTLPLIRAAIAARTPLLAICRGFQEVNVALGGSLHQMLQDIPGRLDHSTPMQPDPRIRTGKAHAVHVTPGGWLHRLSQQDRLAVNSLHNQGIDRVADPLMVEATAPDGTIEAFRLRDGGYGIGVQWHPEFDFETDPVSRAIFEDFAQAVRRHAQGQSAATSVPGGTETPGTLPQGAPPQGTTPQGATPQGATPHGMAR